MALKTYEARIGNHEGRTFGEHYDDVKMKEEGAYRTNKHKTNDAGYLPLEVQLARYKAAGLALQVQRSQFTYQDYKDIYLDEELFSFQDDLISQSEKLELITKRIQENTEKVLERKALQEESSTDSSTITEVAMNKTSANEVIVE